MRSREVIITTCRIFASSAHFCSIPSLRVLREPQRQCPRRRNVGQFNKFEGRIPREEAWRLPDCLLGVVIIHYIRHHQRNCFARQTASHHNNTQSPTSAWSQRGKRTEEGGPEFKCSIFLSMHWTTLCGLSPPSTLQLFHIMGNIIE